MDQPHTRPPDVLAAASGRIAAIAALAGDEERGPWLFAHAWLADSRFESQGRDPARMDQACDDLSALPPEFPSRATLAAVLVDGHLRAGRLSDPEWTARMGRLAQIAAADPEPAPWWPRLHAAVSAHALLLASRDGRPGFRPLAALRELESHERIVGDEERYADLLASVRLGLQRAADEQSVGTFGATEVAVELAATLQTLGDGVADGGEDRELKALAAFVERIQRSDPEAAVAFLDQAAEVARSLLSEDSDSFSPAMAYEAIRMLMDLPDGGSGDGDLPGVGSAAERASALHDKAMGHLEAGTLPALALAAEYARQALDTAAEDDPRRPLYLLTRAVIHLRRVEAAGELGGVGDYREGVDVAAAVALAEQARRLAGSVSHPLWGRISTVLALGYRLSGRAMESRLVALDGLHARAHSIVRQTDAAEIEAAAHEGAAEALTVARWCLADDDPDGAAIAAEFNRGLILYAEAEERGDAAWLLDPPTTEETQATLRERAMDALVYLIPGEEFAGSAVVVKPGAPLEIREEVRDVDDMWDASEEGTFRLVLIPLGELRSVPWPEARHEHMVISYAASARTYCSSSVRESEV